MNNGMKQGNSLEGNGIRSSWEHLGGDCGPWFMFLSIGKSVSSFPFFIALHCSIAYIFAYQFDCAYLMLPSHNLA